MFSCGQKPHGFPFLVFLILIIGALLLPSSSILAAGEEARKLMALIEYIAGDYRNAVKGGKIVSADEYQEMLEFSTRGLELFKQLKTREGRDSAGIEKELRALASHIKEKSGERTVPELAQQIKDRLISAYNIITHPRILPNLAAGRNVYVQNCAQCHGGDLQGVIDRLPYLKELGVTAIWLTPWYDNYDRLNQIELKEDKPSTGFHGYNPQDFYKVDEHFGTLAKLQELVQSAHRLGIKIIQDAVVNHTGPYHPWVDDPPTPTWFNGTKANHLKNVFQTWVLHDPRPVKRLKRETMEGWFLDFLPDLNQYDSEVSRYLIQNTLWWIGVTGLDGIRMDTWQYVPNEFWRDWTAAVKREFPNFKVVGEVKDGDVVHTSYFQKTGAESLLDFPLFYAIRHAFAEGGRIDEIPKTLARDYLYTNPDILVTLLGGHDDGRFMSEKGATIAGLKLANAFVLTTRGVPQLYYGDEIGMTGPDEPTTREDFPGGPRTKEERELFEYIRGLIRLRHELEPLRTGRLINLYVSEQQYAYARGDVIVVINNDDEQAEISFATDLTDGTRMM